MDEKVIWGPDDFFGYMDSTKYDMVANVIRFPEDGSVPLVKNFGHGLIDALLGRVENIHLVDDSTLVGTPYFFDPAITDEDAEEWFKEMRLGGYFKDVVTIPELGPHGGTVVTKARLMVISLIMFEAVPGPPGN